MGIIVNQQDNRSELQKRIAADLSDKAKKKHDPSGKRVDGVDDSAYIEGTKTTTSLAWVWLLVALLAVVVVVLLLILSSNQN